MARNTMIEWCDDTWNPAIGCANDCPWCYGRAMNKRFNWCPEGWEHPVYKPETLSKPYEWKKPRLIFCGSITDLFQPGFDVAFRDRIFTTMRENPRHTFVVLTKRPDLIPMGNYPDNLMMGVSVTGEPDIWRIHTLMNPGIRCGKKIVSIEPYLSEIIGLASLSNLDWIIVGGLTGPKRFKPPQEWIKKITDLGKCQNIPVFLKNNLEGIP